MNNQMGSALPTEKLDGTNFALWEYKMQGASRVLYCLASCVHDHILGYIRDSKTPKEAWEKLKKIFAANTAA